MVYPERIVAKNPERKSIHEKIIGKKYTFAHFLTAAKLVEKR